MKYRVDKGEVNIEYCPTTKILAYLFTKTLKVHLFHNFRGVIIVYKHTNILSTDKLSTKERVRNQQNPKSAQGNSRGEN